MFFNTKAPIHMALGIFVAAECLCAESSRSRPTRLIFLHERFEISIIIAFVIEMET